MLPVDLCGEWLRRSGNCELCAREPGAGTQETVMAATKLTSLILCVDDYENILDGWRMFLEGEGYHVLTSAESIGAMQLFVSHPIDEVILDFEIPGMTVDVFARHMKR